MWRGVDGGLALERKVFDPVDDNCYFIFNIFRFCRKSLDEKKNMG